MSEIVLFAKPLHPSQEAFEAIGFTFEENKDRELLSATLPKGWTFKKKSDWIATGITVYDENNIARAYSCHVAPQRRHVINSDTNLYRRYRIYVINHNDDHKDGKFEIVFVDAQTQTILFSGGRSAYEPAYDTEGYTYSNRHPIVKKCIDFANENYPNWNNPLSYWE